MDFLKHTKSGINPGPRPERNAISETNNGPANKSQTATTKLSPVNAASMGSSTPPKVDKSFLKMADEPIKNSAPMAKKGSGAR